MIYKIIQAEHQSWGVESCNDRNCKNVHLWFTKGFMKDSYYFALSKENHGKPFLWNFPSYCLAKEICIPENGIIKEITSKLKERNNLLDVSVSEEMINEILPGGYKKHLPLLQF